MSYQMTLGYYGDWNIDAILNVFTKGNEADTEMRDVVS